MHHFLLGESFYQSLESLHGYGLYHEAFPSHEPANSILCFDGLLVDLARVLYHSAHAIYHHHYVRKNRRSEHGAD